MTLSTDDLLLLGNTAITAALQAGEVLTHYPRHRITVQNKGGGDSLASQVLTEVDLQCQQVILKTLLPTCQSFDLALLSEESMDDKKRLEKDYFWSIDPLDGTLAFIESTSGYAVSIALLAKTGEALIGVIYDPIKQTLYHAIKGLGAFRNKTSWRIEQPAIGSSSYLTIVSDRSFLQYSYYTKVMSELEIYAHECGFNGLHSIQHGGAAMNACWVLENAPACYFKFPKKQNGGGSLWDYAASACIFNETGAIVSNIHGQALELNRADSCFMNHQGILYASSGDIAQQIRKIYCRFQEL